MDNPNNVSFFNLTYANNISFYNFTAIYPYDGHCEWQHQIGHVGAVKELGPMILGILTALQGIFGMVKSRSVSIGTRYIFSLVFGFGLVSSLHTATLWNGFEKTYEAILKLMQAVVITRLISTMKFPPFNNTCNHVLSSLLLSTFGLYPILAHSCGSGFDNPWVTYLTYDLIWIVILVIGLIIFFYRKSYPQYHTCPEIFTLVFHALFTCILAYTFWLVDFYGCTRAVAILQFYGLWLFFKGITFYYLAVLDGFLHSYWEGYEAVVVRWPQKGIILFVYVSWTKLLPSRHSDERRSVENIAIQSI